MEAESEAAICFKRVDLIYYQLRLRRTKHVRPRETMRGHREAGLGDSEQTRPKMDEAEEYGIWRLVRNRFGQRRRILIIMKYSRRTSANLELQTPNSRSPHAAIIQKINQNISTSCSPKATKRRPEQMARI